MTSLAIESSASRMQEQNATPPDLLKGTYIVGPIIEPDFTGGAVRSNVGRLLGGEAGLWDEERRAMQQGAWATFDGTLRYAQGQIEVNGLPILGTNHGILEMPEQHDTQIIIVDLSTGEVTVAGNDNVEASPSLPAVSIVTKAGEAIDELTRLAPGWDGYSGVAVLSQVADHARDFLGAIGAYTKLVPDVVPLADGGLQLEWFVGDYEVEVEISPDCGTHLFFECKHDGRSEEHSLGNVIDSNFLATYFKEIRR